MIPSTPNPRVAIVTGGIGGIGTEICLHLAEAGRQVIAVDLATRGERIEAFREQMADLQRRHPF